MFRHISPMDNIMCIGTPSGQLQSDPMRIFLALVRSVCEYGRPVRSRGLTNGQSNTLELKQKGAFKIIIYLNNLT